MKRPVTDSVDQLRPYVGGKPIEELARERGLTDIVKLASNECALGPSPLALEAARRSLAHVHRYPDGAGFRLRTALAAFHGVSFEEVIHGNGSNELIELIVRTFMTPGEHMVFGQPAFSMYSVIAPAHNVEYTQVPTRDDLCHDLEGILAAIRFNTKVVLIDNPNNPAGTNVGRDDLIAFLEAVPKEVIVVMDEAYFEFADATGYPNALTLRHLRDRLIVLRTFSKAYGLAGFRVGYGIAPPDLVDYINRLRAPFNVSVPAQEAAIAALEDQKHLERVIALNSEERARLSEALTKAGYRVFPSQTNFLLIDFGVPAEDLYDKLLSEGVIVRPIAGLDTHLRVTLGTRAEDDRFLEAIARVGP